MNRVKELRMQAGMQQKELALAMDVKQASVSRWENQVSDPTDENVLKLSELFGVPAADIVYYAPSQQSLDEYADAGIVVRRVEPPAKTAISEEMISAIVNRVKSDMQMSTPNTLNPSEQELIDDFRQLSPVQKSRVKAMIAGYIDAKYMND